MFATIRPRRSQSLIVLFLLHNRATAEENSFFAILVRLPALVQKHRPSRSQRKGRARGGNVPTGGTALSARSLNEESCCRVKFCDSLPVPGPFCNMPQRITAAVLTHGSENTKGRSIRPAHGSALRADDAPALGFPRIS